MINFSLPSPAKINRFLHITGRRADGYHCLQTLFQFLDYGDQLSFATREDNAIVLNPPAPMDIPLETNLIYRAATALQQAANTQQGITIGVEKILPIGTGLGGGSSNAATTLVALNAAWKLHWTREQLMALGATLGADVPIFIYGHAAWGEGIGTDLTLAEPNEPWVLVVIPPCQVISAKMYGDSDLTRDTPAFKIGTLTKGELESLLSTLRNDFEPLVRRHYPQVDEAMKWLSNFGTAQLSGSGASVFSCYPSLEQAKAVERQLPSQWKGFIAKGLNQSPLMQAMEKLDFK